MNEESTAEATTTENPLRPAPGTITLETPRRRAKAPVHLADRSAADIKDLLAEQGLPAFRGKQVAKQYYERFIRDAELMTDLPAAQREKLGELLLPNLLTPVSTQTADRGRTAKTLWRLHDGATVESVVMVYKDRATVCVSSQAGCGMNCPFCATGQAGLTRNMTTAEIVDQVVHASNWLSKHLSDEKDEERRRVRNVVFMGMGEPLANYKPLIGAIRKLTAPSPEGLGMSARHITVSTVGLVPAMRKLIDEDIPVTLAVSLHAPDDKLRNELVPVNTRWDISETLDAARAYFDKTGRRVSIEYALIRDINDQAWRARKLADRLNMRGRGWVHVNPIPLNPTPGSKWTASDPAVSKAFVDTLVEAGIPTTVRDTRGQDIDGACGQLAAGHRKEPS